VELLKYWKKVETGAKCPVDSLAMEDEAREFVMRVKKFREIRVYPKARELYLQSKTEANTESTADTIFQLRCSLFLDTGTSPAKKKLFMIGNTDYCIITNPTLFGLHFQGMLKNVIHPTTGKLKVGKIEASGTVAALDPLLLEALIFFPDTMLDGSFPINTLEGQLPEAKVKELLEEEHFRSWEPDEILWRKEFMSDIIGSELLNPSIDIICCILLELDRRAGLEGISLDDCRYVLTALYGYELAPGTMRKREDSPARRTLDSETVAT
jgi:hypothetical protein